MLWLYLHKKRSNYIRFPFSTPSLYCHPYVCHLLSLLFLMTHDLLELLQATLHVLVVLAELCRLHTQLTQIPTRHTTYFTPQKILIREAMCQLVSRQEASNLTN